MAINPDIKGFVSGGHLAAMLEKTRAMKNVTEYLTKLEEREDGFAYLVKVGEQVVGYIVVKLEDGQHVVGPPVTEMGFDPELPGMLRSLAEGRVNWLRADPV